MAATKRKKAPAKKTTARKTSTRRAAVKKPVAKKKTTARKAAPKKAVARKVVAKKPKTTAIKDKWTKSQVLSHIAETVGISKKETQGVFEEFFNVAVRHLNKGGIGNFNFEGLKFKTVRKPATKARKGTNPFTGEQMTFKAKPARNVIKLLALKSLKDRIS